MIARLHRERQRLENAEQALRRTLSWRLTLPLRYVSFRLKRLGRRARRAYRAMGAIKP
jgi:hypothetical protein